MSIKREDGKYEIYDSSDGTYFYVNKDYLENVDLKGAVSLEEDLNGGLTVEKAFGNITYYQNVNGSFGFPTKIK